jgi:NhaA family Na+:H+ antiporter
MRYQALTIAFFFIAIIWSNTNDIYYDIFHNRLLHLFINEFLMSFFFLNVGLEIKKELIVGDLSTYKKAILPLLLAFFGAIFPAIIFLIFNLHKATIKGWGIPMATDIALSYLAIRLMRAPKSLETILLSISIIDDLIAVLVIGLFYTNGFSPFFVILILIYTILIWLLGKVFYKNWILLFSIIPLWFIFYKSGIHPSICGILISSFVKLNDIEIWQSKLEKWISFFILPLFILANTGIKFTSFEFNKLLSRLALGIILGLLFGKQIGITLSAFIFKKTGMIDFPKDIEIKHIWIMSITCAIGFTMSIFISELSFPNNSEYLEISKLSIFICSILSFIISFVFSLKIFKHK